MLRTTAQFLLAALVAIALLPWNSFAQTPTFNDELSLQYFDVTIADNNVRMVNPTQSPDAPAFAPGLVCAMVYVFDSHEEMQACCGCPVTNDGLRKLTVKTDLNSNPAVGTTPPPTGLVVVVSAYANKAPVAGTPNLYVPCDPALDYDEAPDLASWIVHADNNHSMQNLSEDEFAEDDTTIPDTFTDTAHGLVSLCNFIHTNGTGRGICTCGTGDNSQAQAGVTAP